MAEFTPEAPPTPKEGEESLVEAGGPTYATLEELTNDFKRLQRQKTRKVGGVEGRILQNLAFISNEHYVSYQNSALTIEPKDPNKLYLMFDMITPRMNKLLGRLSSVAPPYKTRPNKNDPNAWAQAEVADQLIIALDDKLIQPSKTWEILWWMAVGGVAFEHTPWIPNVTIEAMPKYSENGELVFRNQSTGEEVPERVAALQVQSGMFPPEAFEIMEEAQPVGDVGSEILGPLNVFIDQSVQSVADLAPDQRVYIAKIRTIGWVEEVFGIKVEGKTDMSIVSSSFHSTNDAAGSNTLRDLIPTVQGQQGEDDPEMTIVVEAYGPQSSKHPHGTYYCFIPGQEMLKFGESPYDGVPITDFHWTPVTTTFWTPGYIEKLIPPQRFLNKRISQLGEQSNATLYSNLLLGPGLSEKDVPADKPGVVVGGLAENGNPLVQRLGPPEFPAWYIPSIEMVSQMFNDIAGGADLFRESKFPGQLRGPMAVPMLQEILDSEWGPLYNHIGERMAKVKQHRLDRVKQFYPPQRTLHYTSKDQKNEVLVFHTDKVLKSGINFTVTVERGELIPELRALREARLIERLQGPLAILYTDERTGRLDKSKIAADLKFGDASREGREAQYRKLGAEIVNMLQKGQPVPPVQPFYDHGAMMDELEAWMSTMEYLQASPQVQQLASTRWNEHRQFLQAAADAQAASMQSQMVHGAVAQATQQAAATAAADAVDQAMQQVRVQSGLPTKEMVEAAMAQKQAQNQPGGGRPSPGGGGPPRR